MSQISQISLIGLTLLSYPLIVSALTRHQGYPKYIENVANLLSLLLPVFLVLGVVLFVYGLVKYILDLRRKSKTIAAKWLLLSGILLSISSAGFLWYLDYAQPNLGLQSAWGTSYPGALMQIILMADVTQDPILLGASHNIFIGKILAQTGTTESPAGIRTQYAAEVISNIKGNLNGVITVEQEGGFKDGILQTIEDAFPLLEPGSVYVLATRYNAPVNAYTILANEHAGKLLTKDFSLDNAQLKALSDKDPRVQALEAAYAHEVLLDADIAHGNTRNSFQSLAPVEKAAAQSRADAARVSLEAMQQGSPAVR